MWTSQVSLWLWSHVSEDMISCFPFQEPWRAALSNWLWIRVFSREYAIFTGSAQDTEVTKYQIKDCSFLCVEFTRQETEHGDLKSKNSRPPHETLLIIGGAQSSGFLSPHTRRAPIACKITPLVNALSNSGIQASMGGTTAPGLFT